MGKRIGNFNLVNYKDHPTNDVYKILNFNTKEEADLFELKLNEANLFYEKDTETHQGDLLYLFAVKNRDFEMVQRINFRVHATFREPMIKNKFARYSLVLFFIFLMTLAIIGYLKS
jgi:hypothetical protein